MKKFYKLAAPLLCLMALSSGYVQAATITYTLSNHPSSGDSNYNPESLQDFGLRLDGLLTTNPDENYIFDFDHASSSMFLTWDDQTNEINIYGSAYGGQDISSGNCAGGVCVDSNGDGFLDGTEALWTIDFTYDTNTGLYPGDAGGFQDILVGPSGHVNTGTMSSSLGTWDLRDHYTDFYSAAFIFGDDPAVSQYTGVLTGWGMVDYGQNGVYYGPDLGFGAYPTSWLFEATVVPLPAAVWLFASGLIGLIGLARHKSI